MLYHILHVIIMTSMILYRIHVVVVKLYYDIIILYVKKKDAESSLLYVFIIYIERDMYIHISIHIYLYIKY